MEQELEFSEQFKHSLEKEPKHARQRLAKWSETPEGKAAYEKVAKEMRAQIKDFNVAAESYIIGLIGELKGYTDWAPRLLRFARYFCDLGIKWQAEQRKEVGVMIHQGDQEEYGIVELLTWGDIAKIITIYEEGINSGEYKRYDDAKCVKKYSQDILRRFNELKAEKQ